MLTAPNGTQFKFAGVRELLKPTAIAVDTALLPPDAIGGGAVTPLSAAQVSNQLRLQMRRSILGYYEGRLRSDDDMVPCDTRNVCLAVREDAGCRAGAAPPDPRCTGHMHQLVTEAQLYTQLSHYHRQFDVEGVLHSLESQEAKDAAKEKLQPIRQVLDEAAAAAARLRNASAYRWVDLGAMFGRLAAPAATAAR